MSLNQTAPCEHCAGPTEFTTQIAPLGDEPGHRVFFCADCNRFTWTAWQGSYAPAEQAPRPAVQQQQQQQQQPQAPKKPDPDASK